MITSKKYDITNIKNIKDKILIWSEKFNSLAILDNNNYTNTKYKNHEYIAAFGIKSEIKLHSATNSFEKLKQFLHNKNNYIFGYFTYDLKNENKHLKSKNNDNLQFPCLHFFEPQILLKITNNLLTIQSENTGNVDEIYNEIINKKSNFKPVSNIQFKPVFSKNEYLETVNKFKEHIQKGNIYEANLCQEYFSENTDIEPNNIFIELSKISPTPFSAYYKIENNYLMCASPERFATKIDNKIISQPIKGTIKRDKNKLTDLELLNSLKTNKKELSENVMIVDLVRNDLSKIAKKGSVKVEELFGIYSFPQVHQIISTISAEVEPETNSVDIIQNLFPMGSMTGTPKISAMEIIDELEKTKRGLYSGSVGYFSPNNNFDFNVVIRSLLYNSQKKYLSFQVGSAITIKSDNEKEYNECLTKSEAMLLATNGKISIKQN